MTSLPPTDVIWPRDKAAHETPKRCININNYESIRNGISAVRKQLFRQDGTVEVLSCRWSEKHVSDPNPMFSLEQLDSYLNLWHSDQPLHTLFTHLFLIDKANTKSCLDTTEQGMYMLLDRINAFADLGYALWAFLAKDTPTFEGRSTFHASRLLGSSLQDSVLELCMVFKYVELNRNKSSTSPWSIRQQLLYQNFDTKHNRQSIILLRASEVLKKRIQEVFLQNQGYSPHWTNFIVLTVSTLPTGWAEYAEFLDSATSNVAKAASFIDPIVQSPGEADFKTLQATQMYHDLLTRAICVLQGNIRIQELLYKESRKRRRLDSNTYGEQYDLLDSTIEDVNEQLHAIVRHMDLIQSRLIRITAGIQDCIALRSSQQSANEAKNMRMLALSANREARTVKAIALVTLIYLPATFVATFLGMDYVTVTGTRTGSILDVSVQPTLWMFLALTAPLTLATLLAWWVWERWNRKKKDSALGRKDSLV